MTQILATGNYFGNKVLHKAYPQFNLSITDYAEGTLIPNHFHVNPYYSILIKGFYRENGYGCNENVLPGTILYRPANYEHANDFPISYSRCFNIEFIKNNETVDYAIDQLSESLCKRDKMSSAALNIYLAFIQDSRDALKIGCLVSEFMETFANEKPANSTRQQWIAKLKKILDEEYMMHYSLEDLASRVNVHPVHLSKGFKKKYDTTLSGYITKLRTESAIYDLQNTNKDIVHIALESGFYDQSHMNKIFKLLLGISPLQLRKKLKE
jgi:AraC family transcriptional regulator